MYGAIVAAMLATTAPAAADCCWRFAGFGCGPCVYPVWCGYPCWYGCYYPCYSWPVVCYDVPAPGARPAPTAREKALEGQIQELRDQLRKLRGTKPKEDEATAPAPARVVVKLPEDARLFIDDDPCPLTSAKRSFDTPELQPGVTYHYTIRAEVTRAGRAVKKSKRVTVRAGQETVVEFGDMRPVEAASR